MSRLDIMTPSRSQTVIDGLYRDVERRIASSPPGLCPVDLALSFLRLCHAQTCGKCVPCRIGLGQLATLLEQVLNGEATMETLSIIERTVVVAGGGEETLNAVSTLLAQCGKVGGNLNQLARHFNSGGADTEQLRAKLLDELTDLTAFRLNAEKILGELYGNAQAYRLSRKGGYIVQP